jgi:hypothetical protein
MWMKMKIGIPQNPSIGIITFYEITNFYDSLDMLGAGFFQFFH